MIKVVSRALERAIGLLYYVSRPAAAVVGLVTDLARPTRSIGYISVRGRIDVIECPLPEFTAAAVTYLSGAFRRKPGSGSLRAAADHSG